MRKRGQMGESILMIYQLLIISVIAVVVFGVSNIFYNYEIDIRDAEARILSREVVECLSGDGVLDLNNIEVENYDGIVSYCGLSLPDRFYVGVDVMDSSNREIVKFYEGDSGALWVRELFVFTENAVVGDNPNIKKYNPGYFKSEYSVFVLKDNVRQDGKISMEVLVNRDGN
jgi:hypothetical protein